MNARAAAASHPKASAVSQRAVAFVDAHAGQARGLATALAEYVDRPPEFQAALEDGLTALGDPEYADGLTRTAPGVGSVIGVRTPLLQAVTRGLRPAIRSIGSAQAVSLAEPLSRATHFETRAVAVVFLRRILPDDPGRAWQLIRRMAAAASSWVEVDTLARATALGIVLEPHRWVELEQLTSARGRWERRLVGSTIASVPLELPAAHRARLAGSPALTLVASLMGDPEPDVQKALSWSLRTWARVDPAGVAGLLAAETERAATTGDGSRAWVIRDSLQAVPAATATDLRRRLTGVRRHAGAGAGARTAGTAGAGRTEPTRGSAVA